MLRLTAGVLGLLLLWCCSASGQDISPPGAPEAGEKSPAEAAEPGIEELLDVHLQEKDGRLVPVLGYTPDELAKVERILQGIAQQDQPPPYSIQRVTATGTVSLGATAGKYAQLTIVVEVLLRGDDWVRVPLRLDGAILREPVVYEGKGEQSTDFEGSGKGYVSRLRGVASPGGKLAGKLHRLTMNMLVPLATVGDETRLELFTPRANVSELKLKVPVDNAVGKVSEHATLEPPISRNGTTEFTARHLGGHLELAWRKAGGRTAQAPTVLGAEGAVLVRIDSHSVETEATLKVHSHGGSFDSFRVFLPEGAQLIPEDPSGYSVIEIGPRDPGASTRGQVEVRLVEATSEPVEIHLATSRPHHLAKLNEWFELAGFEVVGEAGAARQSGHISIAAVGQWQVRWRGVRGVRQTEIDQLPDALRHDEAVAGFAYFAQPCSLTARLVPKVSRISVEGVYVLLVDGDQVRLEASLPYTVRGEKAFEFDVALPGWEFDEVGPENLVAVDGVKLSDTDLYTIPLLQPSTGRIDLWIHAHRPIPEGTDSLILPLPQPQIASPRPASVVVVAADDVELTPNKASTSGLTAQQVAPRVELPVRQQDPLFYREDGPQARREDGAAARFAAGFRLLQQKISVDLTSDVNLVDLSTKGGSVTQTLAYTIRHKPADHFVLEMSQELADSDELTVSFDKQTLPLARPFGGGLHQPPPDGLPDEEDGEADRPETSRRVRRLVVLPEARIGPCELVVHYPLSSRALTSGQRTTFDVSLVMPAEAEGVELTANKVRVTSAASVEVLPRPGQWTSVQAEVPRPEQPRELLLTAPRRAEQVPLALAWEDDTGGGGGGATVVERAWIRTWLTRGVRQDRAVFAFTSDRRQLRLAIPAGVTPEEVDVRLVKKEATDDGTETEAKLVYEPVVDRAVENGRLVISLPDDEGSPKSRDRKPRRYVLELRYHFNQQRPRAGHLPFELPQLDDEVWVRRMYWQLVLPRNEHVIASPPGFTNEFGWEWGKYVWSRRPLLNQAKLETWVGCPHEERVPEGINCYLFSSTGNVRHGEVRTADRAWIVLIASGAALVVGLLLIYVPASRHPGTLLSVGVVLLCAGALRPEPMLLVSQAASIGLALTLVAGLLQRSVARRREAGPAESSSSILTGGSTRTQRLPPVADSQPSTVLPGEQIPAPPNGNAPAVEPPSNPHANL